MKIDLEKVKKLQQIVANSESDPLRSFVVNAERDLLHAEQEKNLVILFKEALKYNVRYLYVGRGEIAGCENKRQTRHSSSWPAMWAIAENVGFPGSCGNGDQYQCHGSEIAFPPDSFGAWDLETLQKIDDAEADKMKFCRVVTRPWSLP